MSKPNPSKSLPEIKNNLSQTNSYNKQRKNLVSKLTTLTNLMKLWSKAEQGVEIIKNILDYLTEMQTSNINSEKELAERYTEFVKSMNEIVIKHKNLENVRKFQKKKTSELKSAENQLRKAKVNYEKNSKKPNFEVKKPDLERTLKEKKSNVSTKKKELRNSNKVLKQTTREFINIKLKTIKSAYTKLTEDLLAFWRDEAQRHEETIGKLNELPEKLEEDNEEEEESKGSEIKSGSDSEKEEEKEKEKEKKKKKKRRRRRRRRRKIKRRSRK
ncbi:hypothetical protein M0812_27632 [Anaeramoeba flamelloides]|uniref:Uncharacterized protein n=1 Tax=Anaeramoeba flamelloides TaxID=1746091 RepID=A0AAV7Y9E7_9EUKA|nr:hypothetical protein M0812_27632 [Anaeramoeba flamelloides]